MQGAVSRQADGTLALELSAAEHVFPISVEQGGEEYVALFHMTPPSESEIVALLNEMVGRFKTEARGKIVMEPAPREQHVDLFDRHFVCLGGLEGDPSIEEQKAWLDKHPRLKQRVVQEGFGGADVVPSPDGVEPRKGLRLTEIATNKVRIAWTLWCEDTSRAESVTMLHVMRSENAECARSWAKATGRVEAHIRRDTWRILTDYKALCALYDAMAERVDGCLFEGQPCSESNKERWLPNIPAWQKVVAIQEVFAGASPKNV